MTSNHYPVGYVAIVLFLAGLLISYGAWELGGLLAGWLP